MTLLAIDDGISAHGLGLRVLTAVCKLSYKHAFPDATETGEGDSCSMACHYYYSDVKPEATQLPSLANKAFDMPEGYRIVKMSIWSSRRNGALVSHIQYLLHIRSFYFTVLVHTDSR
jgi:hypothetical protein